MPQIESTVAWTDAVEKKGRTFRFCDRFWSDHRRPTLLFEFSVEAYANERPLTQAWHDAVLGLLHDAPQLVMKGGFYEA